MRHKFGILLTLTSIGMMFGCEKLDEPIDSIDSFDHSAGEQQSCDDDHVPHPFLSCIGLTELDPPPYDPVCELGCGGQYYPDDDFGHVWCAIPCDADADCASWDPGESATTCAGGFCHWYCDDQHACPSDLECVGLGDPIPGEPHPYSGECMALDPEPNF